MLLRINPHSGVPVYRQIYDQIHRRIISGQIAQGVQLPSVRELAQKLKVNPMTVSKVYSYLERDGLAQRRRGVGLFVASLTGNKKQRDSQNMVKEAAGKTAIAAIELGITKKQLLEITSELYEENSKEK